ncbi:hypothetical protein SRDD_30150 [Serratia sp. DD3]|nr:hypothetical protein SRDD_30150 [Serratia sp. DD3]
MLITMIVTLFVIVGVVAFMAMPVMEVNHKVGIGGKER